MHKSKQHGYQAFITIFLTERKHKVGRAANRTAGLPYDGEAHPNPESPKEISQGPSDTLPCIGSFQTHISSFQPSLQPLPLFQKPETKGQNRKPEVHKMQRDSRETKEDMLSFSKNGVMSPRHSCDHRKFSYQRLRQNATRAPTFLRLCSEAKRLRPAHPILR